MLDTIAAYDRLITSTTKVIRGIKAYPKILDSSENKHLHPFFDKCLHNALNEVDLIIGLKYLDVSANLGNQVEANYFARIVAHQSYEILNHTNKLFGKNVRQYVQQNVPNSKALSDIDNTLKSLNGIKKENFTKLNEIRNNLFGHKLENGLDQANLILAVDNKYIYDVGSDIHRSNIKLLGQVLELMRELPN